MEISLENFYVDVGAQRVKDFVNIAFYYNQKWVYWAFSKLYIVVEIELQQILTLTPPHTSHWIWLIQVLEGVHFLFCLKYR